VSTAVQKQFASSSVIVAISKFQAENELEVTGEASPQLAGVIKAAIKRQETPVVGANAAAASPPVQDAAALQAAQQACLQEKIARAQEANKKKRGLGSLVRAVARTSSRFGSNEAARDVYEASHITTKAERACARCRVWSWFWPVNHQVVGRQIRIRVVHTRKPVPQELDQRERTPAPKSQRKSREL
jgi:hypothetical protein